MTHRTTKIAPDRTPPAALTAIDYTPPREPRP